MLARCTSGLDLHMLIVPYWYLFRTLLVPKVALGRDVYHGPTVCQLIRKVARSAECRGQGSGPWRSMVWPRRRCWRILRFLKKIARLLDVSCDLTATTVESQSPTTTPFKTSLAPTTTPEPTTPAPTTDPRR